MSEILSQVVEWVWGPVLVVLLFGGGLGLLLFSKGLALRYVGLGVALVLGKSTLGVSSDSKGQLSHFKALSNALAATVGLGNIAGVAVAITQGGPGALLWMWVSGFVGMNTKFFESSLAVMFRSTDSHGQVQGGPMYYLPKVLPSSLGKPLAVAFAVFGLVGTQALFQSNQLASYLHGQTQLPYWVTGLVMALFVGVVLQGGLRRVAQVTSAVVPAMCVVYVGSCLVILGVNADKLLQTLGVILSEAFSFQAAAGGAVGYGILHAFQVGVKRGVFSNEAGVGTAPMAHGNAKTSEPLAEGFVAMVGPLIDTMVVCSMTALVILVSYPNLSSGQEIEGITLTAKAFEAALGSAGAWVLGVSVFFFSFSTLVGMANYNEKCWFFLFKKNMLLRRPVFIVVFSVMVFLGALGQVGDIVNVLDLGFGLMAYSNMVGVLVAAPLVVKKLKKFHAERH